MIDTTQRPPSIRFGPRLVGLPPPNPCHLRERNSEGAGNLADHRFSAQNVSRTVGLVFFRLRQLLKGRVETGSRRGDVVAPAAWRNA